MFGVRLPVSRSSVRGPGERGVAGPVAGRLPTEANAVPARRISPRISGRFALAHEAGVAGQRIAPLSCGAGAVLRGESDTPEKSKFFSTYPMQVLSGRLSRLRPWKIRFRVFTVRARGV